MNHSIDIKPGIGIDDLRFGASIKEAEKVFGKPDDSELLDEIEESKSTVFHYWDNGFSLFFDEQNNQVFCCVEIDNQEACLWGIEIFKLKEKEVIEFMQSKGYNEYESEVHEWGEKRISFEKADMDFYFEKNKMVSINYGCSINPPPILILSN